MKKKFVIAMMCVAMAGVSACVNSGNDGAAAAARPEIPDAVGADDSADVESVADTQTEAASGIVSFETLIDENHIKVTYPVLSGLTDENAQKDWNDYFLQSAQLSTEDLLENSQGEWTWDIATQTDSFLSLLQTSYWDGEGSAHPWSGCSSYNINLATGASVRLRDICDTDAIAADLVAQSSGNQTGKYTVAAPDGTDVTDYVTIDDVVAQNAPDLTTDIPEGKNVSQATVKELLDQVDYDKQDSVSGYSYWKDGQLHLVFLFYHAVGDYVDIAVTDAHGSY